MIEFEVRLEFTNLQSLAKFSFEDRLNAHHVAGFGEYRNRLYRQDRALSSDLLRQPDFIFGANLDDVRQKLRFVYRGLEDLAAQFNLLSTIQVVARQHKKSFMLGCLHGFLPPVQRPFQAGARRLRKPLLVQHAVRHGDYNDRNGGLLLPIVSGRSRLVNHYVTALAADGEIGAGAQRHEQVHLGANLHVVALCWRICVRHFFCRSRRRSSCAGVLFHELVTGRDKQRHVVNLRTRLIETFAQVLQFEGTKSTVVVAVMRKTCPAFISPDHPSLSA